MKYLGSCSVEDQLWTLRFTYPESALLLAVNTLSRLTFIAAKLPDETCLICAAASRKVPSIHRRRENPHHPMIRLDEHSLIVADYGCAVD